MKESVLQSKCIKYAKEHLRNVVVARSSTEGFPDRTFFHNSSAFCVEFKATGKKPSELQIEKHRELYKVGILTFTIDDFDVFKTLISIKRDIYGCVQFPQVLIDCLWHDKVTEKFDL